MDYKKCGNYPGCTLVECECHFNALMKARLRKQKIQSISDYKIVKGKVVKNKQK